MSYKHRTSALLAALSLSLPALAQSKPVPQQPQRQVEAEDELNKLSFFKAESNDDERALKVIRAIEKLPVTLLVALNLPKTEKERDDFVEINFPQSDAKFVRTFMATAENASETILKVFDIGFSNISDRAADDLVNVLGKMAFVENALQATDTSKLIYPGQADTVAKHSLSAIISASTRGIPKLNDELAIAGNRDKAHHDFHDLIQARREALVTTNDIADAPPLIGRALDESITTDIATQLLERQIAILFAIAGTSHLNEKQIKILNDTSDARIMVETGQQSLIKDAQELLKLLKLTEPDTPMKRANTIGNQPLLNNAKLPITRFNRYNAPEIKGFGYGG